MPGMLRRLDDPWGITWRLKNVIKRFDWRRTRRLAAALIRGVHYERPVFILGVPRSGTSMLFQLLRASDELASLPREGHDLWRMFHHPRYHGWRADALGTVRWGERRYVMAYFYSFFAARRFVEKTPENTLRVPYLRDLFPDAIFVLIKRNPCDVINSLINGWRHKEGRYRAYFVPARLRIPGYEHRHRWCFTLIEGWRDYISSPIPEIALAQWEAYVKAIARSRATVPASTWAEVYMEDLLTGPDEMLDRICEKIDIRKTPELTAKMTELVSLPVNALSTPGKDKWRRENEAEIIALLPRIAERAPSLGYVVDPVTGDCTIKR